MTVTLDLEGAYNRSGIIYGIIITSSAVSEQTERVVSGNMNIQLTMSYNSQYNLSVFSNLCGNKLQSELIHIFYGEYIISYTLYIYHY